jgi:hypothetical protein
MFPSTLIKIRPITSALNMPHVIIITGAAMAMRGFAASKLQRRRFKYNIPACHILWLP